MCQYTSWNGRYGRNQRRPSWPQAAHIPGEDVQVCSEPGRQSGWKTAHTDLWPLGYDLEFFFKGSLWPLFGEDTTTGGKGGSWESNEGYHNSRTGQGLWQHSGRSERRQAENIFTVKQVRFADELDMGCGRKGGVRLTRRVLTALQFPGFKDLEFH